MILYSLLCVVASQSSNGSHVDSTIFNGSLDRAVHAETQLIAYKSWQTATRVQHQATVVSVSGQYEEAEAIVNGFLLLNRIAQTTKHLTRRLSPSQPGELQQFGSDGGHFRVVTDSEMTDGALVRRASTVDVEAASDETSPAFEVSMPPYDTLDGIIWPEEGGPQSKFQAHSDSFSPPWHPLFHLHGQKGRGAQGDVWQALRVDKFGRPDFNVAYVLKRLFSNKAAALLSGVREAYFGSRLQQLGEADETGTLEQLVSRFETHFERLMQGTDSTQQQSPPHNSSPARSAAVATADTGEQLQSAVRLFQQRQASTSENTQLAHLPPVLRMLLPPASSPPAVPPAKSSEVPPPHPGPLAVEVAGLLPASQSTVHTTTPEALAGNIAASMPPFLPNPAASSSRQGGRGPATRRGGRKHVGGGERALELWLVFRDEGVALDTLVFSSHSDPLSGMARVLPGGLWHRLVVSPRSLSARLTHSVMLQLLLAVDAIHSHGIVHRDIKPGNVFLQAADDMMDDWQGGRGASSAIGGLELAHSISGMQLRLGDFGSALDLALPPSTLFAPPGAGEWDLTISYAPPEVLAGDAYVGAGAAVLACVTATQQTMDNPGALWECAPPSDWHWPVAGAHPRWPKAAYDAWSAGVSILELALALRPGASMFPLSQRWASMLQLQLQALPSLVKGHFDGLQGYPVAADMLQRLLAEHDWSSGKSVLLSQWVSVCVVPLEALRQRVAVCSSSGQLGSRAPRDAAHTLAVLSNATQDAARLDATSTALEAVLRGSIACMYVQAVSEVAAAAGGGAAACHDGGGSVLRAFREAYWQQTCRFKHHRSHGMRHTRPNPPHSKRGRGGSAEKQDCKQVPVADLQRPIGCLGAAGEEVLQALLHWDAQVRATAVLDGAQRLAQALR